MLVKKDLPPETIQLHDEIGKKIDAKAELFEPLADLTTQAFQLSLAIEEAKRSNRGTFLFQFFSSF